MPRSEQVEAAKRSMTMRADIKARIFLYMMGAGMWETWTVQETERFAETASHVIPEALHGMKIVDPWSPDRRNS